MEKAETVDRVIGALRIGVAALAVAVALLIGLKVPLIATFRSGLVLLAAFEVLSFGRCALSSEGARPIAWAEIVLKLAVLATAYVVLAT